MTSAPVRPQPRALTSLGTRVLLVGTGSHGGRSPLPDLPSVADTVADLGHALVRACGVDPANLRLLIDPDDPLEFGEALGEMAEQTTDVLLLYYTGHTLLSPSGELYLATHATQDLTTGLAYNAFPYSAIRDVLSGCRASSIVVILDCLMPLDSRDTVSARAVIPAGYVLVSASGDDLAFTHELVHLLNEGDVAAPETITFEDVYRHVSHTLAAAGREVPVRHSGSGAGTLVLAENNNPSSPADRARRWTVIETSSPYPGLAPFGVEDSSFFFGRARLTAELLERVRDPSNDMIAVVGPSGSGKTSLLMAGLMARMPPGTRGSVIQPGTDPVRALQGFPPSDSLASLMENVLLIVDQFEELFTVTTHEQDRTAFIAALDDLRSDNFKIVFAVRSSFADRCLGYAQLRECLSNPVQVRSMTPGELRQAIVHPAEAVGLAVEPGLVELLLADLGSDEDPFGPLSLLAHTLLAIWSRRTGGTLTIADYQSVDVRSTVHRMAETVYDRLIEPGKLRTVLLHLVHISKDGTMARRQRVPWRDLPVDIDVLNRLSDQRLVTLDTSTVEISHDALLTWSRLKSWVEAERSGLLLRQELREAAAKWEESGRDRGYLYRGTALTQALEADTPATDEFIGASIRAQRRIRRLGLAAMSALVALTLVAITFAVLAVQQVQRAKEQLEFSVSGVLAAQSETRRVQDPRMSTLLAIAAWRTAHTDEARSALLSAQGIDSTGELRATQGSITAMAVNGDGSLVAAAASDGKVSFLATESGQLLGAITVTPQAVQSLAFSPDGRTLAVAGDSVHLWEVTPAQNPVPLAEFPDKASRVTFSPDGKVLATAGRTEGVRLWDLSTRQPSRTLQMDAGAVAFSPDGRVIAAAGGGEVRLLDTSLRPLSSLQQSDVRDIAFSPDGRFLAVAGGNDKSVVLWQVADSNRPIRLSTFTGHTGAVVAVAYGQNTVVTASTDQTAVVLNVPAPQRPVRLATLVGHTDAVTAVAVTGAPRVISASGDGTVRLWDLDPDRVAARLCQAIGGDVSQEEWQRRAGDVPYRPACD